MNLDNYYIHATGGYRGYFNYKHKLLKILKDNKIKITEENRNYQRSPIHQISLCHPARPEVRGEETGNKLISSFKEFVLYSPSLVFSRDIEVIIPKYENYHFIREKDCADCYDEVRYIGELSLDNVKFITFPLWPQQEKNAFSFEERIDNLKIFKNNILTITKDFNTIPIKDIYTGKNITADEVERQIEVFQKKLK